MINDNWSSNYGIISVNISESRTSVGEEEVQIRQHMTLLYCMMYICYKTTEPLKCQDMYFMSNLNFYIAKTPCQYDKKEIFMQLGFVSGPSFFRFRN